MSAKQQQLSHGVWLVERTGEGKIRACFAGHLDAKAGEESAQRFEEVTHGLDHFALVFDVTAMEGYDNAARRAWGHVMQLRRRNLASIETIGARPIVRLGTSMLGMLAGVQVEHRR